MDKPTKTYWKNRKKVKECKTCGYKGPLTHIHESIFYCPECEQGYCVTLDGVVIKLQDLDTWYKEKPCE